MEDIIFLNKIAQGSAVLARVFGIQYQYNPRELVYQHDKVKLYHYQPRTKKINSTPVLVVFATVNRPEILDLFPERSFISGLLENEMDVYFLDWGYPDANDRGITFSDYVSEYLHHCVEFIKEKNHIDQINLLGICQGGLICLCYAALNHNIKNLILISTPIDFDTEDSKVAQFLRQIDVDLLVEVMGNVYGSWLTQFFISLRPFELIGQKYLRFIDNLDNEILTERFLRVEKWLHDGPDQTGASFTELIKNFYQQNKLIKGQIYINEHRIDLAKLTMPILNVMAKEDEIVPVSSSRVLKKYVGSKDYSQQIFPSGHIGIYVSDKVGGNMSKAIAEWVKEKE